MENYIRSASFNILGGKLQGTMEFAPGLNIISGENGTFKTKLLQTIKQSGPNELSLHVAGHPIRRQAISPKRNLQRQAFQQIVQNLRREDKRLAAIINEQNINDGGFQDYPSLGQLFYATYYDLCRDGGDQIKKMEQTAAEFNAVIQRIFSKYELVANWRDGGPQIELLREPDIRIPIEGLSAGEQEILSLATNLYASRGQYDVFFIDEPEVHLNWHLEEKLFEFLDYLATDHNVQLIVVTHSRVVFTPTFFPKTQFLFWEDDGKVRWSSDVTEEQRRRIAGEAIELIKLGQFKRPTFFVEDNMHSAVIQELATALGKEVGVSMCGDKANVRSLYRLSLTEGDWNNSFFVVDGDNQDDPYPKDNRYIHLDKYCMETYLIDTVLAARISGKSEQEVRQIILAAIQERRDAIFRKGKNKFFEFLVDRLTEADITDESLAKLDASEMFDSFLRGIGMDRSTYLKQYVKKATELGMLDQVFPKHLLEALSPPKPESAQSPLKVV